ncbi:MAG: hypothetical protein ISR83_03170 [Candidatus Marinimicrobia bacterium]|nr:hypothetical protein [Candidatus Neomarinimicrobiota bacterium]
MKRHNSFLIIILFLLSNILSAQSLLNGYGFGGVPSNSAASIMGMGGNSISPTFQLGTSVNNPATWMRLKYTRLNISYINDQSMFSSFEGMNGQTLLGIGQMIVPIKEKYSFGLGLMPYRNQSISITGKESTFIAFGDTISTKKSLNSYGGINSFYFGFGLSPNPAHSVGAKLHLLFGSTRQSIKNNVEGVMSYSNGRYNYSGLLVDLYYSSNFESSINFSGMIQYALNPLSYVSKIYHPFDDTNQSGYHDSEIYSMDFPYQSDVGSAVEGQADNIHSPFQYQIGVDWNVKENIAISGEYLLWKEKGDLSNLSFVLPLNDYVIQRDEFSIGIVRFTPNLLAPKFLDKFQLRSGFHSINYQLSSGNTPINDISFSFGFGFKFKATMNQIDIAYRTGKREYNESLGSENYQQLMAEFTLGDIWFVKRRSR